MNTFERVREDDLRAVQQESGGDPAELARIARIGVAVGEHPRNRHARIAIDLLARQVDLRGHSHADDPPLRLPRHDAHQPKRMLMLTDDELDDVVAWYETHVEHGDHDEEDDDTFEKINALRLKP